MHPRELSRREIELGTPLNASWHQEFEDTNWVFVGGLPPRMTEGDLLVMFSQYGTILDVQLSRDKKTGASRGFAFIEYEQNESSILAVDNFDGIKLLDRVLTVNHRKHERKTPPTPLAILYNEKELFTTNESKQL